MSKLHFSENGLVMPDLCEEVNEYRRAVKELNLPKTKSPARLFFLARPHRMDAPELKVSVNHQLVASVSPQGNIPAFRWYEVSIPPETLAEGKNRLMFWSGGSAMDAWTLALEAGWRESSSSFLTTDGGRTGTWQHKGRLGNLSGEYVVRVRLEEGEDPTPPRFIWETSDHPRFEALREMIPQNVKNSSSTLEKARSLSSWVSQQWEYRSSALASLYTPWDAETIIAWGKAKQGQNGQLPIVMCVHYAIVFVTCCQALGIKARPAVFTEALNSFNGHFAAEVWVPEYKKWVFADPNVDAFFFKDGVPLSVLELKASGEFWKTFAQFGKGYDYQIQNPAIIKFMDIYLTGQFARLYGIWHRADFLSHPEASPPAHGAVAYCETGFIWKDDPELAMFPYREDDSYFTAPPEA